MLRVTIVGPGREDTLQGRQETTNREVLVLRGQDGLGFFDYCRQHARPEGQHFEVTVRPDGIGLRLVVPDTYRALHDPGWLYIVNTNYPTEIMQPSGIPAFERLGKLFWSEVIARNPYADPPFVEVGDGEFILYKGIQGKPVWSRRQFDPSDSGTAADLLHRILSGRDRFYCRPFNFVINSTPHLHRPLAEALGGQYCYDILASDLMRAPDARPRAHATTFV